MATALSSVDDDNDKDLEIYCLIWLDATHEGSRDTEQRLRAIINQLKKFQNAQQCQDYIQQTTDKDRLILIVSGSVGKVLLPSIHDFRQVVSIYIYCMDKKANEQWSSKYSKVKGVIVDINELINQIRDDHKNQKKIEEPLAINIFSVGGQTTSGLNGKFVFVQVLIDCVLRLKTNEIDKHELIHILKHQYQDNVKETSNIDDFQERYESTKALKWYTKDSFFYKTLNSVLRTENIQMIFLFRSFIADIQDQLKTYQTKEVVKVYRAQLMSKDELNYLQKSINQFISINSFFSTSKNRSQALSFFNDPSLPENIEKILFEIEANPKVVKTKPFADISRFSDFPGEEEILFMIGSIFRLRNISFDHGNQNWIIGMTLSSEDDNDLKEVLVYMKQQTGTGETNIRIFAKTLWTMGKTDLAEKYLQRSLKQLPSNDPLLGGIYEDLGELTSQTGRLDESMEWRQKLLRFLEKNPRPRATEPKINPAHLAQIPSSDLELLEKIGSGGFGTVHRARWLSNEMIIAVKKLPPVHLDENMEEMFFNELSLLNRIRHPNIITFYGACMEKERYALVMKFMSLGSLYHLLHVKKVEVSWCDRLSIALQAAKGVNYLHQFKPVIIHRDIKSLNLLLENHTAGYIIKVCDFGMAKTRSETTRQTKGNILKSFTLPWAAPEVLESDPYTEKSDIHSLGIVYWELATNRIPYNDNHDDIIIKTVLAGRRLKIPDGISSNFRTVIEKCWAQKPADRPVCSD